MATIEEAAAPERWSYDSSSANRPPGEWAAVWARICRTQAAVTKDPVTKACLIALAEDYAQFAEQERLGRPDGPTPLS